MVENLEFREQYFPLVKICPSNPKFGDCDGRQIIPAGEYWLNQNTVAFAIFADAENPHFVYLARRTPDIQRALEDSGLKMGRRLCESATILRRLGGI